MNITDNNTDAIFRSAMRELDNLLDGDTLTVADEIAFERLSNAMEKAYDVIWKDKHNLVEDEFDLDDDSIKCFCISTEFLTGLAKAFHDKANQVRKVHLGATVASIYLDGFPFILPVWFDNLEDCDQDEQPFFLDVKNPALSSAITFLKSHIMSYALHINTQYEMEVFGCLFCAAEEEAYDIEYDLGFFIDAHSAAECLELPEELQNATALISIYRCLLQSIYKVVLHKEVIQVPHGVFETMPRLKRIYLCGLHTKVYSFEPSGFDPNPHPDCKMVFSLRQLYLDNDFGNVTFSAPASRLYPLAYCMRS